MPFSCNPSFLSHSSAELNLCAGLSPSQVSTGEKDRCNALCSKVLLIFLRLLEASEDVPRITFCALVGVMGRGVPAAGPHPCGPGWAPCCLWLLGLWLTSLSLFPQAWEDGPLTSLTGWGCVSKIGDVLLSSDGVVTGDVYFKVSFIFSQQ